ncbi:MAG TPA: hypothetical protein VK929_07405 [Longimicrobiales bacterium]|nr:hypothetical protein [Longimicrobiales bacterium]
MPEVHQLYPMGDRHDAELRAGAEMERLPGVVTAAVWLNSDGQLLDARIQIMPGVAPTIIANAAARVLQALNIPFDQGSIRATHLNLPDEIQSVTMAPAPTAGRFLLLQDLTLSRSGAHISCRVQLMRGDVPAIGEARELDTIAGRARAAANATLRAAENAAENLALGLEAAATTEFFGRNYAVVSVEASVGRRVANLSGMVPLDPARAPEEAICLATLRAIDRWIAL